MSEPDHDALAVREDWLREMGLAEDEVAALARRAPAPSLADELTNLWAARRLGAASREYVSALREAARRRRAA